MGQKKLIGQSAGRLFTWESATLQIHSSRIVIFMFTALAILWGVAPSLAKNGKLRVNSTPKQAYVFVDGVAVQEASKCRECGISLSPGEHTIGIYNYGYKPATRQVTIPEGKAVDLNVSLEPDPGDVSGTCGCITIENAQRDVILLNGKTREFFVGHGDEFNHNWWWKQELVVPEGTHQLTVLKGDKEVWSGPVTVPANQRVVVDIPKGVRKTIAWPRGEQKCKSSPRFSAGTASTTVAVAKPTAQLSASKDKIRCGEESQLKWSTTEAPVVEISNLGKVAASGEKAVQSLRETTYKLTASGPGGTATSSTTVSADTAIQASLDLSPREVKYHRVGNQVREQSKANLNWSTSNASTVNIDGLGQVDASGSRSIEVTPRKTSVGPVDEEVTYTLKATNCAEAAAETRTAKLHITGSIEPEESTEEVKALETRLSLHSVYFPTDQPTIAHPEGGLLESQQQTLLTLAADFKKYLAHKPDAQLVLEGHADKRGSAEYNKALSERRVNKTKQFLVENGISADRVELRGMGSQNNLSTAEVKQLIEQQTDLGEAERNKILKNLGTIVLAQNRRVDVTLSTTGEQSIRQYPFNAADSLTLLSTKNIAVSAKKKAKTINK